MTCWSWAPCAQTGPGEGPGARGGHDQGGVDAVAAVGVAHDLAGRFVQRRLGPGIGRGGLGIATGQGVLEGIAVGDLFAVGSQRAGLQTGRTQIRCRPQKGQIHPPGQPVDLGLAFGAGHELVVTKRQQRLVVDQQLRVLGQIDIGPVGDIQPPLLGEADQRQLQSQEIARPRTLGIGPIERQHPGPVGERRVPARTTRPLRRRAQTTKIAVAPVVIPRLPGQHAALNHQRGVTGRIPHRQRHITLLTAIRAQLEQIRPRQPRPIDRHRHRHRPRTLHHVRLRPQPAPGLLHPAQRRRRPHQPAPQTPVIPHPKRRNVITRRRRRHKQPHRLTHPSRRVIRVPLNRRPPRHPRQPPRRRTHPTILTHHPSRLQRPRHRRRRSR